MGTCFFGGKFRKFCSATLFSFALVCFNFCGNLWALSAQSGSIVHLVEKGETLYGISRKYGVSV
ncbi:MAG: LysM peptidoglycan-binding domain-containing protein, partial [Treponema sp.]|nr:LysM peptidoglycan-binding domain-containing protein [Treponema sp.]